MALQTAVAKWGHLISFQILQVFGRVDASGELSRIGA